MLTGSTTVPMLPRTLFPFSCQRQEMPARQARSLVDRRRGVTALRALRHCERHCTSKGTGGLVLEVSAVLLGWVVRRHGLRGGRQLKNY